MCIIPVPDFLGGGTGIILYRISTLLVSLTVETVFVTCTNLQQVLRREYTNIKHMRITKRPWALDAWLELGCLHFHVHPR
jgi:hypothetical protein